MRARGPRDWSGKGGNGTVPFPRRAGPDPCGSVSRADGAIRLPERLDKRWTRLDNSGQGKPVIPLEFTKAVFRSLQRAAGRTGTRGELLQVFARAVARVRACMRAGIR